MASERSNAAGDASAGRDSHDRAATKGFTVARLMRAVWTTIGRSSDWLFGLLAGLLLALTFHQNSLLAKHTTPLLASWAAYGLAAVAAALLAIVNCRRSHAAKRSSAASVVKTPLWFYLGGLPGTLTLILAVVTVNGGLKLSGTMAPMFVGQVLFGIVSDRFGLFRCPKRQLGAADALGVLSVLAGSALILYGKG